MKILIINHRFLFTRGPERYMFNIIPELEARNHEIITFSVKNKNNRPSSYSSYFARNIGNSNEYLYEKYKKGPLFYYDYVTREFYSFYIRRKLRKLLKDTKPDICYLLPHKVALSPSVIDELKKHRIPIVHRASDYNIICSNSAFYQGGRYCDDCLKSRKEIIKNRCIKGSLGFSVFRYLSSSLHNKLGLYTKVDRLVTTNPFARDRFLQFGFNPAKVNTVLTFGNPPEEEAPLKQYPRNRPLLFIYVGHIDEAKGGYDLIEACRLLREQYNQSEFRVEVYGGMRDEEIKNLQPLISRSGLEDRLILCGKVAPEKINEVYRKADITIIPTRGVENLPNVLIESLMNKTPVLIPNFGSLPTCTDDTVAYYYNYLDVDSLACKMNELISNPETITEKAARCLPYAQKYFNKEKHVHQLLKIFEELLSQKERDNRQAGGD